MMKKIKLTIALLAFSLSLFADEAFVIDNYKVEMDVRESNTYEITETLDINFTADRHGIIRDIPLYFDGMPVKISRIKVRGHDYKVDIGRENASIRIGSADSYVNGKVQYIISYLYDVGGDNLPDMDEFNHNVIGVQWDTQIKRGEFRITLPKEFNPEDVNCTSGPYGSTDNSQVEWSVEGTTITGKTLKSLDNYEGLTVALPLPEGYWVNAKRHHPPGYFLFLILGYPLYVLVALVTFILWFLKGRDNQLFPTVQFEPPEGLTPAEIGYIIDGSVDSKDVTSLIIYWAEKGCVAIETEQKGRGRKKSLELIRLKELPPESRSYEKRIFKELFAKGTGDRVSTEDLTNSFYKTVNWGMINIAKTFTDSKEKRIFTKSTGGLTFLAGLLGFLPIFMILLEGFQGVWQDSGPTWILAITVAAMLIFLFARIGDGLGNRAMAGNAKTLGVLLAVGSAVILGLGVLLVLVFELALYKYIAAMASGFVGAFFAAIMSRRTEYGDRILEKVLGFREFIKEAEKDKLETLFESNPSYFYDILPYAMVMGLSSKWSSHFEKMAMEPPSWYRGYGYDRFRPRAFEKDLSRDFSTISTSMSSSPSSGSSGSSSSGGFSGGGSGGGGGSSW